MVHYAYVNRGECVRVLDGSALFQVVVQTEDSLQQSQSLLISSAQNVSHERVFLRDGFDC